eukprot:283691-Rhodomonas_salina.3
MADGEGGDAPPPAPPNAAVHSHETQQHGADPMAVDGDQTQSAAPAKQMVMSSYQIFFRQKKEQGFDVKAVAEMWREMSNEERALWSPGGSEGAKYVAGLHSGRPSQSDSGAPAQLPDGAQAQPGAGESGASGQNLTPRTASSQNLSMMFFGEGESESTKGTDPAPPAPTSRWVSAKRLQELAVPEAGKDASDSPRVKKAKTATKKDAGKVELDSPRAVNEEGKKPSKGKR